MGCATSEEAPAAPVTVASVDRAAAARYVLGRRTPAGGYSFYRTPAWGVEEPNAPGTLAAVGSLRLLGIDVPEPGTTERWLQTLQGDDGGYPTLTIGWAALRTLDALGGRPVRSPTNWLERVTARMLTQRPAVDRRGALVDKSRLAELLWLTGGKPSAEQRRAAMELLGSAEDPLGGRARPSADLGTTAVALCLGARHRAISTLQDTWQGLRAAHLLDEHREEP